MNRYCKHCQRSVEAAKDSFSGLEICSVCGIAIGDMKLESGTILGGVEIKNEIGQGSIGTVYRAIRLDTGKPAAVKILSSALAQDSEYVEAFFKEAKSAINIDHPAIVRTLDTGSTPEGITYLVMELADGEPLERIIEKNGPLSQAETLHIAIQVADAMRIAWEEQKLTHGDIKPENIIISSSGQAKIADLGLAKKIHGEDPDGEITAAALYAAPELITGHAQIPTVKTDIYSFGATIYQMLTGAPPFPGNDPHDIFAMHLTQELIPLAERKPELNPALSELVDAMLSKIPSERISSWAEVADALSQIAAAKIPDALVKRSRKEEYKNRKAVVIILGIILIIGLLIYLYHNKDSSRDTEHKQNTHTLQDNPNK